MPVHLAYSVSFPALKTLVNFGSVNNPVCMEPWGLVEQHTQRRKRRKTGIVYGNFISAVGVYLPEHETGTNDVSAGIRPQRTSAERH